MSEKTAQRVLIALIIALPFIIYGGNRLWDIRIEGVIRDVVKAECLK
jgi:hypothetical protein